MGRSVYAHVHCFRSRNGVDVLVDTVSLESYKGRFASQIFYLSDLCDFIKVCIEDSEGDSCFCKYCDPEYNSEAED